MRERRGLTQAELADAIGISERHYRRLEDEKIFDPGIRLLHNCALALGCSVAELLPSEFLTWTPLVDERPEPPEWENFFRPERADEPDLSVTLHRVYPDDLVNEPWLKERIKGLRRLARQHGLAEQGPILKIAPPPTTDERLSPSLDVLNHAAAQRDHKSIRPQDLLLAIAEIDEGEAGHLFDELGVRQAIIDHLG